MEIVEKIDSFDELCMPTKVRIRNMMQVNEIEANSVLQMSDNIRCDFIFVLKGTLKIIL